MSIAFHVLGKANADNALLVEVDSGHSVERLLFDCGEHCLDGVPFADILGLDHVFFSHFHMDHIAGFDSLFRALFNRVVRPNVIWGPPGTTEVMHHRFRGYLWNLHEGLPAVWRVMEIHEDRVTATRFELTEAFAVAHDEGSHPRNGPILHGAGFSVEAITMDHHTPSIAYVVRENPKWNFDTSRLEAAGLRSGAWMKELKDAPEFEGLITVDGTPRHAVELRRLVLVKSPGDSVAYLTDFQLDAAAMERLTPFLAGCRSIVCESQYRHEDIELARQHCHMTSVLSATLAKQAGAEALILFHLSDRYTPDVWREMLREAREIFPAARFPQHWNLDIS